MNINNNNPAKYSDFSLQFINGEWVSGSSSRSLENINPFNNDVLGTIQLASCDDVDKAFHCAQSAQISWAKRDAAERIGYIEKILSILSNRKEEIIEWIIQESGSTRIKATLEWQSTYALTKEFMSYPDRVEGKMMSHPVNGKKSFVFREALGVIGVISPWNFPLYLSIRSIFPALVLGNTVVVKPASDTPVTGALLIAKILDEAGLPPGVFNVVVGSGSEIGDYFSAHKVPSLISFTGSTDVGRNVGRIATGGQYIKRIALELGGNCPLVVLDDADLEAAVGAAVLGRFLHQGQICMSTNRIIVDKSLYADFSEMFVKRVRNLKVGNPFEADTIIGPIINKQQLNGLLNKIKHADVSLEKLLGGEHKGQLLPPHIYGNVSNSHALAQDEIFGPVVSLIVADNESHALQLANDTEYGLSSAVFTSDMDRGINFSRGIVAGMTHINDITIDDQPNAPFGGEKNSGLGRFNGDYLVDEFTRTHWITWQKAHSNYPV